MPILDGVEAAKTITKKIRAGELPRTIMIAHSAGQLRVDEENIYFNEAGFSSYVSKPMPKDGFMNILRDYGVL